MRVNDRELIVTRSTDNPGRVTLGGDVADLRDDSERLNGMLTLNVNDWNSMLGELFFGLSSRDVSPKYQPTFRSLFSYLVRRGIEAFASPFKHHGVQQEWDKQVNNASGWHGYMPADSRNLKDEENQPPSARGSGGSAGRNDWHPG